MIQRPTIQQYQSQTPGTPLRALIINNATNSPGLTPIAGAAASAATNIPALTPLAQCVSLQKQHFSHVKFKCLNFEELAVSAISRLCLDLTHLIYIY